jgi:hypothetical protein
MTLPPLEELETTVEALIENAKALIEVSRGSVTAEELSKLQGRQEELIAEIIKKDKAVQKLGDGVKSESAWSRIQEKLDLFGTLNESFIQNLSIRKGLINFEIEEVRKTRKSLAHVRTRYGNQPGDEKSRVNTIS